MSSFSQKMDQYLADIQQELDRQLPVTGQEYDGLLQAMRYSVMNAGKRLRPVLALEFCRMCNGEEKAALPFACAVEMIHCYSLIHDDLPCMDDDDLRRGKPSCHKVFGEATALLAGDALLTKAFDLIAGSDLAARYPQRGIEGVKLLSRYAGADGMVGGQVIDLACEAHDGKDSEAFVTPELLSKMHELKTCALIQSACELGAVAAGASEKQRLAAREYGKYLGLAFQLVDDILDVTGTVEELGKPIGSDEEQEKITFIQLLGLDAVQKMAEEHTRKALEALAPFEDADFIKELTASLLQRKK